MLPYGKAFNHAIWSIYNISYISPTKISLQIRVIYLTKPTIWGEIGRVEVATNFFPV